MSQPAAWFVVFKGRAGLEGRRWWHRLLHPAAQHVLAIREMEGGRALVLNHTGEQTLVELAEMPAEQLARGLMWALGAEVLRVAPPPPRQPRAMLRGPLSCVEHVKALLGLRLPFVWTPRQLRRALIWRGALPVAPGIVAIDLPAARRASPIFDAAA